MGSHWLKQNPGWEWHGGFATIVNGSKSAIFVCRRVGARIKTEGLGEKEQINRRMDQILKRLRYKMMRKKKYLKPNRNVLAFYKIISCALRQHMVPWS